MDVKTYCNKGSSFNSGVLLFSQDPRPASPHCHWLISLAGKKNTPAKRLEVPSTLRCDLGIQKTPRKKLTAGIFKLMVCRCFPFPQNDHSLVPCQNFYSRICPNIQSPGLYPSFGGLKHVETISSSNENLVDDKLMRQWSWGSDHESSPAVSMASFRS